MKKQAVQHYANKEYDQALAFYRKAIKAVLQSTEAAPVGFEQAGAKYGQLDYTQLMDFMALQNNIALLLTQRAQPGDLSDALDHYTEVEAAFEAYGYSRSNERSHGWSEVNITVVEIPILRMKARLRKAKIYNSLNSGLATVHCLHLLIIWVRHLTRRSRSAGSHTCCEHQRGSRQFP